MHQIQASVSMSEVVRGISAVLGFTPVESLVLVEVEGDELGCVLRIDLAYAALPDGIAHLADLVDGHDADGALAIVVSTDEERCDRFSSMVSEVGEALEQHGRRLFGGVLVDRIEEGGRWTCIDNCGAAGVLGDPSASVMAAAAVAQGRRIYGSRAELAATVAVDYSRAAAVAPLVGDVARVDCVEGSVRMAVDAMRRMALGEVPTDAELACVGASLGDCRVRDALFNIGDAEESAKAEALWIVLSRVLPDPLRAEALTLLAFSAFLRGDGSLAGVALDAALADIPNHRMAGMLEIALKSGISPEQLRGLTANIPPAVTV